MLKIKDDVDLKELEKFGFNNVDEDSAKEELYTTCYGDYDYEFNNTYARYITAGRRGQEYYILIHKQTRIIYMYATKPDGDGTKGKIDDTIIKLYQANLVEKVCGENE